MNWYMSFVDSCFKHLRMICEILFAGSCTPGEGKIARENWLQSRLLMSLSKKMRVTTVFLVAIVLNAMEKVFETRGRGGGISNVPELSPSRSKELWGLPMREKGCWMTKEICVWIHQQGVRLCRKESKTTWLTCEPQWSTKMEKRKHYMESTKQCPLKTPRIKASKSRSIQHLYCYRNNL